MPYHAAGDPDAVGRVRAALVAAGLADTVRTFDDEVPTAAAAAGVLGCDLGAIANSLVFELDGAPLLILASGAARVDTKLVAERIGSARIRRASPDFVLAHTGQRVGGVAPVGHPAPLRTLLDTHLAAYPVLWAGAGDHRSMLSISYDDLARVTGARALEVR
ncbi:YbaK/EbsC family protein [Sinomonas atrocyanea]|jgi:prolyl-tRNA editing enzyme YbaK/EbsC (Cys-tRNA(Pro) deacylase)|uniref:YbaK/EbsC family protein n=1 Tax=Sinomonas atrocyanea TaxID=37927 RepID=UPI00278261D9|nr:YbaK/EbsC family protein [Sinomonas atrocyanea]MDQ0259881.1 prolyl-tRNA editing enzyme YbaK/EbsC (Cys-tRNA(Pro) deacylase) [Sinomonas atrocyanea]MDR6619902.1 prolyl-tRNA editing enzyme YbaK/EbsC (Cys-tRNA(Pro) deacylase) [Sinomonas atrocyanea]